jgi:hypothetical protein
MAEKRDPATRAAGRVRDKFNCLAALNDPHISQIAPKIQALRAKRRRRARSSAPPTSEIYDGARLIGTIRTGRGAFAAFGADGRKLGAFRTAKDAMRAVCDAARATGEARP